MKKAAEEFATRGYHATSVAHILDGLDIARGTFYQYFANKRSIFDDILDDLLERVSAEVRQIEISFQKSDPIEKISGNIARILETALSDKATAKVILSGITGFDLEFDQKVSAFFDHIRSLIVRSLVTGRKMGVVRDVDKELVASCILGCVKEIINELIDSPRAAPDYRAIAGKVMDCIAYGIFSKPFGN